MSENDSSNSRIENTDNNDDIKPTPLKFTTEFNVSLQLIIIVLVI